MNVKNGSRQLLCLGLLSLALGALPAAAAEEGGTQVVVRMASGELPEAQQLVRLLTAEDGKHPVEVNVRKTPEQHEATLKLWGPTVTQADIPQTLRDAFPALATADIQVSTLDASERPRIEEGEGRRVRKLIQQEGHKEQ